MRGSFALVLPVALAAFASPLFAQPKADLKKDPPVDAGLKIGAKTIDQCIKEFAARDVSRREGSIRYVALFPQDVAAKAIPGLLDELSKPQPTDLSVRASVCVVLGELFRTNDRIDTRLQMRAAAVVKRYLHDPQVVMRFPRPRPSARSGAEAKIAIPDSSACPRTSRAGRFARRRPRLGLIAYDKQSGPNLTVLPSPLRHARRSRVPGPARGDPVAHLSRSAGRPGRERRATSSRSSRWPRTSEVAMQIWGPAPSPMPGRISPPRCSGRSAS